MKTKLLLSFIIMLGVLAYDVFITGATYLDLRKLFIVFSIAYILLVISGSFNWSSSSKKSSSSGADGGGSSWGDGGDSSGCGGGGD
ncbi:hypothetical protein D5018_10345 [Parashewanella curva]|uniref:Uncharacterized protein n=1 Tax=Parashewanella curva TaxID=2338552 RepID=A0A3L8PWT3_9GAMM|nr:hypothetical protein [Parashewanella curva]RLV59761.1 hypothetical protein D5018_10345 [Parashewanella curva]